MLQFQNIPTSGFVVDIAQYNWRPISVLSKELDHVYRRHGHIYGRVQGVIWSLLMQTRLPVLGWHACLNYMKEPPC